MFFIFKNSRIFDIQDFRYVIAISYPGLLATTKLIREDNINIRKYGRITNLRIIFIKIWS